jgi:periplasmic divalent cation tolerance protein
MEGMTDVVMMMTASDSAEHADGLARLLVDARLAACVQVLAPMRSTYRWHGEVEQADEHLLLIKTTQARVAEVSDVVLEHSTYELPEITIAELRGGSDLYLAWVRQSVG